MARPALLALPLALVLAACGGGAANTPFVWVTEAPASTVDTGDLVIKEGDNLNVRVFGQDNLSSQQRVRSDGKIATPAVGEIMAAVEEETRMTRCMDGGIGCLGEERCLTHRLWHGLGGHIAAFLWNVTLAEVLAGIPDDKLARPVAGARNANGIEWAAE